MKLRMRINISFVSVMVLALSSIVACSKKSDHEPGQGFLAMGLERNRTQIPLDSVQSQEGCLSVPLYAMALRQLRPDLPLLQVTTGVDLHRGRGVRDAFRLLTAFGNFKFETHNGADMLDLQGFTQEGCDKVIHTATDGTREEYRIKQAKPDFLMAESASLNRISYRWLSPDRVAITTRHKALDLPCSAGSAVVEVRQVLDWTGYLPAALRKTDPIYIEDDYLARLASAVGTEQAGYYQQAPGEEGRVLLTAKLTELAKANVRQELVTCNGATPPPPHQPGDPDDPVDPAPTPDPTPVPDPVPNPDDPVLPPLPPPPSPEDPPVPPPPPTPEDPDEDDEDDEEDDDEREEDDLLAPR
jgi:hypothetical protein